MERKISLTVDFGFEFGIKYWFFVVFGRLVVTVNNRILVFFLFLCLFGVKNCSLILKWLTFSLVSELH